MYFNPVSPFHQTLPKSSTFVNWISIWFHKTDFISKKLPADLPWKILNIARKLFAKKNRQKSHLTARRLPESQKRAKKVQKRPNSMAFQTEKDLKSKNVRGKFFSQGWQKIKSQTKGLFLVHTDSWQF